MHSGADDDCDGATDEGERQIVRYVRGEEIENTSFTWDEQGNEYYIPAIREGAGSGFSAGDLGNGLRTEYRCFPALPPDLSKANSVTMRMGQAGPRFKRNVGERRETC